MLACRRIFLVMNCGRVNSLTRRTRQSGTSYPSNFCDGTRRRTCRDNNTMVSAYRRGPDRHHEAEEPPPPVSLPRSFEGNVPPHLLICLRHWSTSSRCCCIGLASSYPRNHYTKRSHCTVFHPHREVDSSRSPAAIRDTRTRVQLYCLPVSRVAVYTLRVFTTLISQAQKRKFALAGLYSQQPHENLEGVPAKIGLSHKRRMFSQQPFVGVSDGNASGIVSGIGQAASMNLSTLDFCGIMQNI
ncbi:hypothetical protein C8R47DRAFT_1093741 [Mycena vitilis]|nr:hypothetical protein C8R47DRAFT_1093741 [Mycena vitilis]